MSAFTSVEKTLSYVYRVDGLSAYPGNPIGALADDGCMRSHSGLSRLDHITQGAMIMSLIHSSIDSTQQAILEIRFIDGDDIERYQRRFNAAVLLVGKFKKVTRLKRSNEYLVSEALRWGGDSRGRFTRRVVRDNGVGYVGQRAWAAKEGVHPRTLRNHNREFHHFLNDELQAAYLALDIPFTDAMLVGVLD
ncbi:MAG: hypothetical protein ACKVJE_17275 [Pseudomonadales bacterium]